MASSPGEGIPGQGSPGKLGLIPARKQGGKPGDPWRAQQQNQVGSCVPGPGLSLCQQHPTSQARSCPLYRRGNRASRGSAAHGLQPGPSWRDPRLPAKPMPSALARLWALLMKGLSLLFQPLLGGFPRHCLHLCHLLTGMGCHPEAETCGLSMGGRGGRSLALYKCRVCLVYSHCPPHLPDSCSRRAARCPLGHL